MFASAKRLVAAAKFYLSLILLQKQNRFYRAVLSFADRFALKHSFVPFFVLTNR